MTLTLFVSSRAHVNPPEPPESAHSRGRSPLCQTCLLSVLLEGSCATLLLKARLGRVSPGPSLVPPPGAPPSLGKRACASRWVLFALRSASPRTSLQARAKRLIVLKDNNIILNCAFKLLLLTQKRRHFHFCFF